MSPWRSQQGVVDVGLLLFLGLLLAGLLIGAGAWLGRDLQGQISVWLPVLLIVVGVVFLLIEAAIPGFGVFGFTGVLLLAAGIMAAGASVQDAVRALGVALVIAPVLALVVGRVAVRKGYWRRLTLGTTLTAAQGFVAAPDRMYLAGKQGKAVTLLRPAGAAEIEGRRVDVVTEGDFIPAGATIVVRKVEGTRVVVERAGGSGN